MTSISNPILTVLLPCLLANMFSKGFIKSLGLVAVSLVEHLDSDDGSRETLLIIPSLASSIFFCLGKVQALNCFINCALKRYLAPLIVSLQRWINKLWLVALLGAIFAQTAFIMASKVDTLPWAIIIW